MNGNLVVLAVPHAAQGVVVERGFDVRAQLRHGQEIHAAPRVMGDRGR